MLLSVVCICYVLTPCYDLSLPISFCDSDIVKYGEPRGIFLEHIFVDLFKLRERFRDLRMVIKDGKVFLPDLEERDV